MIAAILAATALAAPDLTTGDWVVVAVHRVIAPDQIPGQCFVQAKVDQVVHGETYKPGQAVALTVAVFTIVLVLFATRIIRVTERMRMVVMVGMIAIALVYLVSFIVSLFGSKVPMIHDSGPVGIGFSLVVVGFAAFKLLIDFDIVERGIAMRAPRYMEWYAAFGLLLTIIWLYMELLRLLAKLRQR